MISYSFLKLLSYFTDLQGSQTAILYDIYSYMLSYFTDLQGSQTSNSLMERWNSLVTLLIYKVLKPVSLIDCNVVA